MTPKKFESKFRGYQFGESRAMPVLSSHKQKDAMQAADLTITIGSAERAEKELGAQSYLLYGNSEFSNSVAVVPLPTSGAQIEINQANCDSAT